MELFGRCRWPELAPDTDSALRAAVRFILERFDVHGIIAAGTHVSGNPDPGSDLDIYVIHAHPLRQRIQKRFEGVPAEIFVNPPAAVRRYFTEERRCPLTAHMLASGFVVLDLAPVVQELRSEAEDWLKRPLELTEAQLTEARYLAADAFENARDLMGRDAAGAIRILNAAVGDMLDYALFANQRSVPRAKAYMGELAKRDPELGELARRYFLAHDVAEHFASAEQIAARTIAETGFFEWESPLEPVPPFQEDMTTQDYTELDNAEGE